MKLTLGNFVSGLFYILNRKRSSHGKYPANSFIQKEGTQDCLAGKKL